MEATEKNLLTAAQAGDRQALERLLTDAAPRVARFAARMCPNPADADEIAQETLIAAVRALPNFRGDAAISTWLYAIARRFCIKQRRRGRSVREADASLDPPNSLTAQSLTDDDPPPDMRLADRELGAAIEDAVADLPPIYREVLILRDMEGLSAPEVAEALGLGVEAVKSRLHRARLSVRERLAPALSEPQEPLPSPGGCPDVLAMYSRHLEGDIQPATCAAMEAHLQHCPRCQGRCDALRRTLLLCKTSPGPAVTPSTQQLVRTALQRALAKEGLNPSVARPLL